MNFWNLFFRFALLGSFFDFDFDFWGVGECYLLLFTTYVL